MPIKTREAGRVIVIDGVDYPLPEIATDALIHVYSDGATNELLVQAQGQPEPIHANPSFTKIQIVELSASPEAVLAEHKKSAQEQCNAKRDQCIDEGFMFEGVHYQTRPTDRENISGAALLATQVKMAGGGADGDYRWQDADSDFEWIAADNSIVKMDAAKTMRFGQQAAGYKQSLTMFSRNVKNQIETAGTLEEIQQIVEEATWPVV